MGAPDQKGKLKILFLVPSFPSISETFIINQIVDLIDRGHEVSIFASAKAEVALHSKIIEYDLLKKTVFAEIPVNISQRIKNFLSILFSSDKTDRRRLLKTLNIFRYKADAVKLSSFYRVAWLQQLDDCFDIVHAHFGYMASYYYRGRECGYFANAQLVVTFHGYDMMPSDKEVNRYRYKELFENNTLITTNNEYSRSLLLKIKEDYNNIRLLAVGLDTEYYTPIKIIKSDKAKNILFCGRLIELKGPKRVVEIANILINIRGNVHLNFWLIGDGDEEHISGLTNLIETYGLEEKVKLLGPMLQDDVIRLMNKADVFILPGITDVKGRAENQGLVIQEAQAMGLPVIVTDAGGMKYGLIDKVTGFVIKEYDLPGFSNCIEELISDTDLCDEMGIAGRKFVKDNYDIRILGDKLEDIYFDLKAGVVL